MPWMQTVLGMSALMALLLLAWPLMRRRVTAGWRYGICVVVLIGLLVPVRPAHPALPAAPVRVELPARTVRLAQPEAKTAAAIGDEAGVSAQPAVARQIDGMRALVFLWLAGALLMLGWGIARHAILMRRIRRLGRVEQDAAPGVRTLRLPMDGGPFVMGLVRPTLVLPEGWALDELVIRHELVHIRRKDALFRWLVLLVRAAHWFNPLARAFARLAAEECELSCDERALSGADEGARRAYAGQILSAAARAPDPLTSAWNGGKRQMKRRLMGILDGRPKRRGIAALALVLMLVLGTGQVLAVEQQVQFTDLKGLVAGCGTTFEPMAEADNTNWLIENGARLNPNAALAEDWALRRLSADYVGDGAGGERVTMSAVVALAEKGEPRPQAEWDALLLEALGRAAADGYYDSDAAMRQMHEALDAEGSSWALQGLITGGGPARSGDEGYRCGFQSWSPEIGRIDETDRRQSFLDTAARLELTPVSDPRELTMGNALALREQIVMDYAGRQVVVEFANGSVWLMFDGAEMDYRSYNRKNGTRVDLALYAGLVALTGLPPEQIKKEAWEAFIQLGKDETVQDAQLAQAVHDEIARKYGITDTDRLKECMGVFVQ